MKKKKQVKMSEIIFLFIAAFSCLVIGYNTNTRIDLLKETGIRTTAKVVDAYGLRYKVHHIVEYYDNNIEKVTTEISNSSINVGDEIEIFVSTKDKSDIMLVDKNRNYSMYLGAVIFFIIGLLGIFMRKNNISV